MPKDPRRNKHHFLARHLLQHFASEDGRVSVHDRHREWTIWRDLPEKVAFENHLYAPGVAAPGDDPNDDAVERWLEEEVDTPAAPPIRALVAGATTDELSSDELHAVANFVAVLDLRTPAVRDLLMPAFRTVGERAMRDLKHTQKELRKQGFHVTLGEVRRQARANVSRMAEEMAKPAWLGYLKNTRALARNNVTARRWVMLDAPEGSAFITSDLGIAKAILSFLEPAPWEPGTACWRSHWLVPLSPTRALAIVPTAAPEPVASAELVAATNLRMLRDARRFAYARDPLPRDLLAQAPDREGTSGTPPALA